MPLNEMLMTMAKQSLANWLGRAGNQARGEVYMEQLIENVVAAQEAAAAAQQQAV